MSKVFSSRIATLAAMCIFTVAGAAVPASAQCQLASDNFARASLGANWTTEPGSSGTLDIAAGTAVELASGGISDHSTIYWNAASFDPSQYSAITLSTLGN